MMVSVRNITENRKVRLNFQILASAVAGIVLQGSEVKSLRGGHARIDEAYARVVGEEMYLYGLFIAEYSHGGHFNHDPVRKRKLLLRKREIRKFALAAAPKGLAIVPLKLFFNERNLAKVELALVQGKSKADKRETIKKREADRQIRNAMRR